MKKTMWMVIMGVVLILFSIGLSVLGALRIVYIVKTDPFEDIPKYIFKVLGLVGIILLQIFGYGGGVALIIIGCALGSKEDKKTVEAAKQPQVVSEISSEPESDSFVRYQEVHIENNELFIKDEVIDMNTISNVSMKGNEVKFKVELKDYLIVCPGSAEAVQLVGKIKQYSK